MPTPASDHAADDLYSADELGPYRSLSSLAVATLGLGLLSPLVFVSPLLVVVPLAAIAAGLLAGSRVAASGGNLSGAALARWGLALAIVCAVASVARDRIRDRLYQRQATDVARHWLQEVSAGNLESALRRMTPEATRKLRPTNVTPDIAQTFDEQLIAAMLNQDPLVEALAELRQRGDIRLNPAEFTMAPRTGAPQIAITFAATANAAPPLQLVVVVVRSAYPKLGPSWRVDSWQIIDE